MIDRAFDLEDVTLRVGTELLMVKKGSERSSDVFNWTLSQFRRPQGLFCVTKPTFGYCQPMSAFLAMGQVRLAIKAVLSFDNGKHVILSV